MRKGIAWLFLSAVGTFIVVTPFIATARAADINLRITKEGQIINTASPNQIYGELYRGWRQNILFASLSQQIAPTNSTDGQVVSIGITSDRNNLERIDPKLYAIHGALAEPLLQTDQERSWLVTAIPDSQVTIVAQVPHGVFASPILWQYIGWLSRIPDNIWLVLGILSPLSLILVLSLRQRTIRRQHSTVPQVHPELLAASPAALTVLLRGFVSRRATAATLIDLACRGHIEILINSDRIILFKRQGRDTLREHERVALERWLKVKWNSSSNGPAKEIKTEVTKNLNQDMHLAAYREVNAWNWFTPSPLITHWKVLVSTFFLTLLTSLLFFVLYVDIPTATPLLWFLGGIFVTIAILYAWAPRITHLNRAGQADLAALLQTRAALVHNPPMYQSKPGEMANWENWFALALVTDCVASWFEQLKETTFYQPEWLLTPEPLRGFDEFLLYIRPVLRLATESIQDTILPAYL